MEKLDTIIKDEPGCQSDIKVVTWRRLYPNTVFFSIFWSCHFRRTIFRVCILRPRCKLSHHFIHFRQKEQTFTKKSIWVGVFMFAFFALLVSIIFEKPSFHKVAITTLCYTCSLPLHGYSTQNSIITVNGCEQSVWFALIVICRLYRNDSCRCSWYIYVYLFNKKCWIYHWCNELRVHSELYTSKRVLTLNHDVSTINIAVILLLLLLFCESDKIRNTLLIVVVI